MTILHPVAVRLGSSRLYGNIVPAPFTPVGAVVARCEDLVASGVDMIQVSLQGWRRPDALQVLREVTRLPRAATVLVAVAKDVDLAQELHSDVVVLGPGQPLPGPGTLPDSSVVGRDAYDMAGVRAAFEEAGLGFVVLRRHALSSAMVDLAHQLGPLGAREGAITAGGDARPWFLDLGSSWSTAGLAQGRAARVRFDVFVPADSPTLEPSVELRWGVAELKSTVDEMFEADATIAQAQQAVQADNSAASTHFRVPSGDPGTAPQPPDHGRGSDAEDSESGKGTWARLRDRFRS